MSHYRSETNDRSSMEGGGNKMIVIDMFDKCVSQAIFVFEKSLKYRIELNASPTVTTFVCSLLTKFLVSLVIL